MDTEESVGSLPNPEHRVECVIPVYRDGWLGRTFIRDIATGTEWQGVTKIVERYEFSLEGPQGELEVTVGPAAQPPLLPGIYRFAQSAVCLVWLYLPTTYAEDHDGELPPLDAGRDGDHPGNKLPAHYRRLRRCAHVSNDERPQR